MQATLKPLESILKEDKFSFVRGNIADREFVFDLFQREKFDVVVNFAAESHVDRSIENPGVFCRQIFWERRYSWMRQENSVQDRFHQVGTDEVYGDLPLDRPDLFFTEKTPITASSPYSASKASLIFWSWHITERMDFPCQYPGVPTITDLTSSLKS